MSIIETIVGLVPTVRDRAKAVLNFLTSKTGKVICAVLFTLSVLGFTHHLGVESQQEKIESLKKELGTAKLQLAAAQQKAPSCPEKAEEGASPKPKSWLDDQAKAAEVLNSKVKSYEKDLAKRHARSGYRLTPAESSRLLDIR